MNFFDGFVLVRILDKLNTLLTSSVYMCENFVAYLFYAYFNDSYNIEYNDMVFCREKLTN